MSFVFLVKKKIKTQTLAEKSIQKDEVEDGNFSIVSNPSWRVYIEVKIKFALKIPSKRVFVC